MRRVTVRDPERIRTVLVIWLRSVVVLSAVFALLRWLSDEPPGWGILGALVAACTLLVGWKLYAGCVALQVTGSGIRTGRRHLAWDEVRSVAVLPEEVRLHVEDERTLPAGSRGRIIDPGADNTTHLVVTVPAPRSGDVLRAVAAQAPATVARSGIGN